MSDVGRAHARLLAALWALEGMAWLKVQGEIHAAYGEAPFWILLAPEKPAIEAHQHFWSALEPELANFSGYRVSVSYKSLTDTGVLWHGFFEGRDEMHRALNLEHWGRPVSQGVEGASIFMLGRPPTSPSRKKRGHEGRRRR